MIGLLRLGLVGAVVLAGVYLLARTYLRSLRREALEEEWDISHPAQPEGRADFVAQRMAAYEHSLRARLVLLVIVIPVVAVSAMVYIINYQ